MNAKVFIDTNIFVYAALEEGEKTKREAAIGFLDRLNDTEVFVSTQVINEFYSALLKHRISETDIQSKINTIIKNTTVTLLSVNIIRKSWNIRGKYQFSLWDSLIIASALENECVTLYSEDMQHNQLIEKKLKILNPLAQ